MNIDAILEANGNLFQTSFPNTDVSLTYRILSLKEYKVFRSLREGGVFPAPLIAEMVFDRCYVGSADVLPPDTPAGLTTTIGNLIMHISGDCDQDTLKDDIAAARIMSPPDSVYEYMRSAIISAFPVYTIDIIEDWTRREFIQNFVAAENILVKQNAEYQMLDLTEIKTSEELAEEERKKQNAPIDFAKDNRQIRGAMGPWSEEDQQPAQSLTREQLERLSEFRSEM
jgi:hypothetical protein